MAKVAFLGLGVMGYPMAGHLRKKGGHEVTVYNRSGAKAEKRHLRHAVLLRGGPRLPDLPPMSVSRRCVNRKAVIARSAATKQSRAACTRPRIASLRSQ